MILLLALLMPIAFAPGSVTALRLLEKVFSHQQTGLLPINPA
jgi:hypothetical protein